MSPLKIFPVCLGCPKNRVDIEVALASIRAIQPIELKLTPEESDIILINTCSFIEKAVTESIDTILELAEIKSPNQRLIVMGCLPQRYRTELVKALPEVDLFLGTESPQTIGKIIVQHLTQERTSQDIILNKRETPNFAQREILSPSTYLKISEGCSNNCSFCLIPTIRGRLRNRPIDDIVKEARFLETQGVRELILIAQDLTAYKDQQYRLPDLLKSLVENTDIPWIRLLYLNPAGITIKLLETIAQYDRILNYLDIPIQHASSDILAGMNRPYNWQYLEDLFKKIHDILPEAVIRTTVMVGFPGETDKDFKLLLDTIQKQQFLNLGCFTYSDEEGIRASSMTPKIPREIAQDRKSTIMSQQAEIAKRLNSQYVGQELPVIVHGYSSETDLLLEGRTWFQAPEIDGLVYITSGTANCGDIVNVKITDSHVYDLVGEISEPS